MIIIAQGKGKASGKIMERIENRMAVDSQWSWNVPVEVREKLRLPGYREMGTGVFVPEEDAFDYALEQCFETVPAGIGLLKWTQDFREMLVEWFYSNNWIKEA